MYALKGKGRFTGKETKTYRGERMVDMLKQAFILKKIFND